MRTESGSEIYHLSFLNRLDLSNLPTLTSKLSSSVPVQEPSMLVAASSVLAKSFSMLLLSSKLVCTRILAKIALIRLEGCIEEF